jgi:hypothetical protein
MVVLRKAALFAGLIVAAACGQVFGFEDPVYDPAYGSSSGAGGTAGSGALGGSGGVGATAGSGGVGATAGSGGAGGTGGPAPDGGAGGTTTVTGPDLSALAPANNEVTGWVGDTTNPRTGGVAKIARNKTDAVNLIDGSADPFFSGGVTAKGLAYQVYVNSVIPALGIDLRAWQLASTSDCQQVYANLLSYSTYSGQPWQDIALGDEARIASRGIGVRVNVCKGTYLIEAALSGDATQQGRDKLVAFVNAILAKIP